MFNNNQITNMKQYIFFSATAVIMATACMKEEGNYDYTPINEAVIKLDPEVTGKLGEQLVVTPEIALTQDAAGGVDENRYAYSWVIQVNTTTVREIAKTRVFDQKLDSLDVGTYVASFSIKDKQTGVSYAQKFRLTVTTAAYEGFFVLGALGDSSRLDLLAFDGANMDETELFTDVLTAFNSGYPRPIGKPLGMYTATKTNDYQFFISTTTGTNSLDRNTLKWSANKAISFLCFGKIPDNFVPERFWSLGSLYVMYNGGNIHTYTNASLFNLGAPHNHVRGEAQPFRASRYFNVGTGGSASVLMFDEEKRRFARVIMRTTGTDAYASLINTVTGSKFDFSDVKMDLVWMSRNVSAGNVTAVLKNDAEEYWLAIFNPSTSAQAMFQKMNVGADFASFAGIAADPVWSTLYYASGNKLYAYLPDANREVMVQDFGEPVTQLFFPNNITNTAFYANYRDKLMVATFNASQPETGGTLRFFSTFNQGSVPQLTPTVSHGGFAKVKEVAFRSRSGNL